jgi:hypothetical protein
MLAEASQRGWEGVTAKRVDAHCSLVFEADRRLCQVGHRGGGLTRSSLRDVLARLKTLRCRNSPFAEPVKSNEPAH